MLSTLSQFNKVQSLTTPTATYAVGKYLKFWDTTNREWYGGKISEITESEGYFVKLKITYSSYQKQHTIDIYREDWLQFE